MCSRILVVAALLLLRVVDCAAQQESAMSKGYSLNEQAALGVFKAQCSKCHGSSVERGDRAADPRDKAGHPPIDYITDLKKLAASRLVNAATPSQSLLWKMVESGKMPLDDNEVGGVHLPKAQKDAIWSWLSSLGDPEASKRTPIGEADIIGHLVRDQSSLLATQARHARYFTLANLYNAEVPSRDLDVSRAALFKLLNSLSRKRPLVVPVALDQQRTLFRVFIDELGWTEAQWIKLVEKYPYSIDRGTSGDRYVRQVVGSEIPVIRADWFVFHASRPPLYHDLLGIPGTDRELEKQLGVDVAADVSSGRVLRAGLGKGNSEVSSNNRLVERHASSAGAYWKSYDFARNDGTSSLFTFPLGPGGPHGFEQAGGEIIFNLPNGLQGYMLVDAKGTRIEDAPDIIVQDRNEVDGRTTKVYNGISCMGCHEVGMQSKFKDEVRSYANSDRIFTGSVLSQINALYRSEAELKSALKEDQDRFVSALRALGVDPALKLGGYEMILGLAKRFQESLDLKAAAAELGVTKGEFASLLDRTAGPTELQGVKARLKTGGIISRDEFVSVLPELSENLQLGAVLRPLPAGWLIDPATGCGMDASYTFIRAESIAWSGPCPGRVVQGSGIVRLFKGSLEVGHLAGEFLAGRFRSGWGTGVMRPPPPPPPPGPSGVRNGWGMSVMLHGNMRFEGAFLEDRPHGHGVAVYNNGDRYDGEFKNGDPDGIGKFIGFDGGRYDGDFKRGTFDGRGLYVYSDGDRYDGEWRNGLPNGNGKATTPGGKIYEGTWRMGCLRTPQGATVSFLSSHEACGFK